MFGDLGDKADDAGESIHGLGDESKDLDTRLDETRGHLRALVAEFEKTGDVSLFRDIRKDRSTVSLLEGLRKELGGVGDAAQEAFGQALESAKSFDVRIEGTRAHLRSLIREFESTGNAKLLPQISQDRSTISLLESLRKQLRGDDVSRGFIETLGALPSQLKGAAIVGLVGAAAAAAPAVGAAIGGAVLGGVGLGGIVGGVALAAQDDRVKAAGAALGEHFTSGLKDSAKPFVAPLLAEMNTLGRAGDKLVDEFGDGFAKLAPLIRPLARGIEGLVDELGPGLSDAFSAAQPVIRAIANELPEVGEALSDMLSAIAEEGDGATEGMLSLLHAIEFTAEATGFLIGQLEYEYQHLVDIGSALDDLKEKAPATSIIFGGGFALMTDEAGDLKDGLADATTANGDFYLSMVDTTRAVNAGSQALKDFASALLDEFDPIANFLHRQQDLKQAQQDLNEAIHDHGRKSDEAKAAELRLAEAILASNAAATAVAGTFNGHFTPALRAALKAGGLTEKQINDLQKSTQAYRHELENLAGNYKVTVTSEFLDYRRGERELSRRASGGPVQSGRSYWVGENGPEIVTVGANGYVTPAGQSAAMARGWNGSGASGGPAVTSVEGRMVLDVRGAQDAIGQAIAQMLRVDPSFRATVKSYLADA